MVESVASWFVVAVLVSAVLFAITIPLALLVASLFRSLGAAFISYFVPVLAFSPFILIAFVVLLIEPAPCPPPPLYGIYCKGDPVPWVEVLGFLSGLLIVGLVPTCRYSRRAIEHWIK